MKAPEEFKASSGNPLGKFPSLKDGEVRVYESGVITEYLCETYDKENRLIPKDVDERIKVLQWLHAAEGTFMIHSLAITYARWNIPKQAQDDGVLEQTENGLAVNVQKDLDWLETELSFSQGSFLCGEHVTAADTMMQFSIDFILVTGLGTQGREWPNIQKWLKACKETVTFRKAVEKSGYELTAKRPEAN
ncbi:uncharacterized protein N0V89_002049 [Didymosphaeria variabile]|uniref:Glutathione S-transferase n=1 Tax=Didymosphaeria variabile TaxID=1932322 RepID=A0A9W9CEB4_9PLEO|nr:uncharacterized protein N0V89_002049 [Didymosphaeria variabile]KAJ4357473.1 hypothetical protein N0V89_002049 [Didymosphaeria variabile]